MLERQLAEKTLSTGQHIRELTDIRTELTQERSALSSLKQELNSKAAAKLEQAQKKHIQECQELQDMIGKLRNDRISAQKDLDKVKSLLKGKTAWLLVSTFVQTCRQFCLTYIICLLTVLCCEQIILLLDMHKALIVIFFTSRSSTCTVCICLSALYIYYICTKCVCVCVYIYIFTEADLCFNSFSCKMVDVYF